MKNTKNRKIVFGILSMLLVCSFLTGSIFGITPTEPGKGNEITPITDLAGDIWSTIVVVVQVAAIAAVVFSGLRYMFASANDKADIKKQTITLVIGGILVFAAVPFTKLVVNVATDLLKGGSGTSAPNIEVDPRNPNQMSQ